MKKLFRKLLGIDQPKYRVIQNPGNWYFYVERRVWLFWQEDGYPNEDGVWIPTRFRAKEYADLYIMTMTRINSYA
jgi:hypothetical protein